MVPQISPSCSIQSVTDIKIFGDRVYSTWEDTRNSNGDIYCNVRSFQNPDTVIIGINPITANIPKGFKLYPAYPNPFNPETEIKFNLPQNTFVTLKIYNVLGEEVTSIINNEYRDAGSYSVKFNGSDLAGGIYFYSIDAGIYKEVKKMVLIK